MTEQLIDDAATVIQSIRDGEYDAELDQIVQTAVQRRKFTQVNSFHSQAVPGTRVRIKSGRPRYLIGEMATVTRVMQTWVFIRLDRDIGKFSSHVDNIRCPMTMLEVVK